MKITVDTNVLVRVATRDDLKQFRKAAAQMKSAELIAIPLTCLCEFVWVLRRVYGFEPKDILLALNALLDAENVFVNRPAVDAGLEVLKAGGDFADGVIAYEGRWLGGETLVSFDREALKIIANQGYRTVLLT